MDPSGQYEIRRLEIKRELRLKELEAQAQQRKEELEARKEELRAQKYKKDFELKHEREMRALELNARRIAYEESMATKFDLGKNVRLVPPFNESEIVDKYSQHFERVAQNLSWPTDQWPLLLQSDLKGKAQEAYTALPISECMDYNCVKKIEEFKRCVRDDSITYLDEQKVENLAKPAAYTDDYMH